MDDELLAGGVENAGSVVRRGGHVLRPGNSRSAVVHGVLAGLRAAGFEGASNPVGIDSDGRERLEFIPGDVAVPPYPAWARTEDALLSIVELLRALHDASTRIDLPSGPWSDELADPGGGPVLCHNDVCLENVVFREGRAVGLIDFDFAAPGRRAFDVAQFARMCVPVDDDVNAARLGWPPGGRPERLRLVADAYGLDRGDRQMLLEALTTTIDLGGEFVHRRVAAGHAGFLAMWEAMGGQERFDRRRRWWADRIDGFAAALGV
jgi:hypothetical protein